MQSAMQQQVTKATKPRLNTTSKRERIIEAAFRGMFKQGIAGITMRSIAQEAGISQGMLHYYYEDKEHLLEEFLEALFARFIHDIARRYQESDSQKTKLEAFFLSGREFLEKRRELFVVMTDVWTYCYRRKRLRQKYAGLNERLTGVLENIIAKGKEGGEFNDVDEHTLAVMFVSFIIGLGCLWHMDNQSFKVLDQFQIMARNLQRLVLRSDDGKNCCENDEPPR
jgi:AcrR family transcriptional regulator